MKTNSSPLRIFLVEDHPDTLDYMRQYLQQLGHTVFPAGSMREALEILPQADCDVLISDLGLPDGLGWDLLPALKLPRPLYAIAMSGFNRAADIARSKATGFHHHLRKPFNIQDLQKALEEARRFKESAPGVTNDSVALN